MCSFVCKADVTADFSGQRLHAVVTELVGKVGKRDSERDVRKTGQLLVTRLEIKTSPVLPKVRSKNLKTAESKSHRVGKA